MLDSKAIGNKIYSLRSSGSMSQDQMAEKLYVTRQAVSKWELGQSLPSVDSLLEMCSLFSVSFEEILCLDSDSSFSSEDIFKGHSREFVIKRIVEGQSGLSIPDIFYQLSVPERRIVLSAIKEKKLKTDLDELFPKLTPGEQNYLTGGKENAYVRGKRIERI